MAHKSLLDEEPQHINPDGETDAEIGVKVGGAGGAIMGAVAGAMVGPAGAFLGAVIGGVTGAIASGVAVASVDKHDGDSPTLRQETLGPDGVVTIRTTVSEETIVPEVVEITPIRSGLNDSWLDTHVEATAPPTMPTATLNAEGALDLKNTR